MDIFLPDAVCALHLIAFRYLPIYEARNLTEPFYCAVRSGGPQSLLVRVNDQRLTVLLRLRSLYSREHIQDTFILHRLTMFVICWKITSYGTRCSKAWRWRKQYSPKRRYILDCMRQLSEYVNTCRWRRNLCIHTQDVGSCFTHVSYLDRRVDMC